MARLGKRIFVIPDTQVRPGDPTDHLVWIGKAIKEYAPDYLIHLGDHYDMPSMSTWAQPGSIGREGVRYAEDIAAGNDALSKLHDAMGGFRPERKIILTGNHEQRIQRVVDADPKLAGTLGYHNFNDRSLGWERVDYLGSTPGVIELEGVSFAHYFAQPLTSKPIGGTAAYKLNAIGTPYVQGHVQGYDIGTKQYATGRVIRGIVAGSCYLVDEEYRGNANTHFRGCVVLNEVKKGDFSEMPITLEHLCHKHTGRTLGSYLRRNYKRASERFSLARAA